MDSDSWEEVKTGSSSSSTTTTTNIDSPPPIPTFSYRHRLHGKDGEDEIDQTELLFNKLHIFLPKSIKVKDIAGLNHTLLHDTGSSDNSIKQLQRDIQRDQLLINGVRLVGADAGLEGVIEQLESSIDAILNECKLSTEINRKRDMCLAVLQSACRTNSGGISYAALQFVLQAALKPDAILDAHASTHSNDLSPTASTSTNTKTRLERSLTDDLLSKYIIVPMSSLAPPLTIRVSVDDIIVESEDELSSSNTNEIGNECDVDKSKSKSKQSEVISEISGGQQNNNNNQSKSTSGTTSLSTSFRSLFRNRFTFYRARVEPSTAATATSVEVSATTEAAVNTPQQPLIQQESNTTIQQLPPVKRLRTWGLRCYVESVTVFSLKSIEDTEPRLSESSLAQVAASDTSKLVKVLYSNTISVPLVAKSDGEKYDFTISSGLVDVSMYNSSGGSSSS